MSTKRLRLWILIAVLGIWVGAVAALLPLMAASPAPHGVCGVERWAVKTLADPEAPSITATPVTATVDDLRLLPLPGIVGQQTPRYPAEKRIYKVSATLRAAKQEGDHDYHLVLVGSTPASTMVAEIPDPACLASQTPKPTAAVIAAITQARTNFDQIFGSISDESAKGFTPINRPVTITGVLFFDFYHKQTGCAKVPSNAPKPAACVELHPVLSILTP